MKNTKRSYFSAAAAALSNTSRRRQHADPYANMFVKIAKTTDIPDPGKQYFEVDDRLVVLFHVGGEYYCLEDVCTHDGGPLGEGTLEDNTIACPRHGAKFDITNGAALTMPATAGTTAHKIKVDGDDVFVELTED